MAHDDQETPVNKALFVRLRAKAGRESEVEAFLRDGLSAVMEVRWRRKFGQLAKVGSTSMKDGLYDWEAEAVHG